MKLLKCMWQRLGTFACIILLPLRYSGYCANAQAKKAVQLVQSKMTQYWCLFSLDFWEFLRISKPLRTVIYKHTACSLNNSLNETKYNGQASKKNIFDSLTNQQRMFASKVSTPLIGASKNNLHIEILMKDYKIISMILYTFERQMSRDIWDVFLR